MVDGVLVDAVRSVRVARARHADPEAELGQIELMAPRFALDVGVEEIVVGATAEVEQLRLDRSGVGHGPTFSMSVARGIDRGRPYDAFRTLNT